jgi:tetratricopeptide (TPR) repeat protein
MSAAPQPASQPLAGPEGSPRDGKPGPVRSTARPPPRRLWWFRGAAILLGLAPLLLLEVGLRLTGVAPRESLEDPFVGFRAVPPLFVRQGDRYQIPISRQEYFRPESFAAVKPADEFRIFCLGGSTVQGRPYAIETSFTTWLEIALQSADPSRRWEVVNCGGVSYASYRLAPIAKEILENYQPDLLIIYSGHNEFLEERSYGHLREVPGAVVTAHQWLSHSRTYRLVRSALAGWSRSRGNDLRPVLPAEVDALLDYRGGLEQYRRDDDWTAGVMRHFELNLERMLTMAGEHRVPVILVQPVVDLKDTPPFKFANRADITPEDKSRFDQLWQQAQQQSGRPAETVEWLRSALAIDPRHAGAWFFLGKCYESLGDGSSARECFLKARDEDLCPLRIRAPMYDAIGRVARRHQAPLVDVRPLFEAQCELHIPGKEVMLDHVHPSIEGHQMIALRLLGEMQRQQWVQPREGWESERKQRFRDHLLSLDEVYFARGKMRLEGLRMWSQGRSFKVRPSPGRQAIDASPPAAAAGKSP